MSNFEKYADFWINKRQSGKHLAHDFLEKPAMSKILANYDYEKVLCLGCGSGEECTTFLPKKVVGVDISQSLIKNAIYTYPEISFYTANITDLSFLNEQKFDLIYSSLTLHYLKDWISFFTNLKKVCEPKAKIIFSVQHPVKWGSLSVRQKDVNQFIMGYKKDKKNQKFEIYGDYLGSRKISDVLFNKLKIEFYHRSISQMFQEIQASGFRVVNLHEPKPVIESKKLHPDFYEVYSKIPLFLIWEVCLD
jgi:SAM-dependent methyltransferase